MHRLTSNINSYKFRLKERSPHFPTMISKSTVYDFKNNYYSEYSKDMFEAGVQASMSANGLIHHDVDQVADKVIMNSEIMGRRGERALRKLKRMALPLPSVQQSR